MLDNIYFKWPSKLFENILPHMNKQYLAEADSYSCSSGYVHNVSQTLSPMSRDCRNLWPPHNY